MTAHRTSQARKQRLLSELARGPRTGSELRAALEISQPTLSRYVGGEQSIRRIGTTRNSVYGAARPISGVTEPVFIYEVLQTGATRRVGRLMPIEPAPQYLMATDDQAGALERAYVDLPYVLNDLRPQGFLGRQLQKRHPELGLPPDVRNWTDTHVLRYLTAVGSEQPGNLIVGDQALQRYLDGTIRDFAAVDEAQRPSTYLQFADGALSQAPVGSSAGGEQPKFLATISADRLRPVIVKFSPPTDTPVGRRIADLLVAEDIAQRTMREMGVAAANTEIVKAGQRVFLESERFDRTPDFGRRGVLSLGSLDAEFVGDFGSWSGAAKKLHQQHIIADAELETVRRAELFGRLIANSDMHQGNFSFFVDGQFNVTGCCPVYDMNPALFAPVGNQLPPRSFVAPVPSPVDSDIWPLVFLQALLFWEAVASSEDVSLDFREVAIACRRELQLLAPLLSTLPV